MHLLIRRSQHDASWFQGTFGHSMLFALDARIELTPDEQELFDKYNLGEIAIYDSDARQQHRHAALESYDASDQASANILSESSLETLQNTLAAMWHLASGIFHTVVTRLSLQITLGTLIEGIHVETESLEEIM